jgi:hypothetical protein
MATDPDSLAAQSVTESKWVVRGLLTAVALIVLAIGYGLYQSDGRFLLQLRETDVSRGLITFLVALVTVSIALIVAVWVLTSNAEGEELKTRFSYSKDVLATLVGILGTILGFYFGTSEKSTTEQLVLADAQFRSGQLIAHVTGGTAPYRYAVNVGETDQKPSKVSKDGWIFEALPRGLEAGSQVNVDVLDSKDRKASRSTKFQPEDGQTPQPPIVPQKATQPASSTPTAPQPPASPASK